MVSGRPASPLYPFVEGYEGYRSVGAAPGVHRGLPSRHLTFIVSLGDSIDVLAQSDARQAPDRYGVVLGGLQDGPALIARGGHEEGVDIRLTPLGCRALLGLPARALWNTSTEADGVLGPVAVELQHRLLGTASWADRFAACDHVLGRLIGPAGRVAPETWEAWRVLVDSRGTVPVAEVARHVGWSRRHLAQRFGDEFGMPPKLAARIIRFERARRMLQRPRRPSIAEVAATCGYYDQPHLNRDFVELAGCAPGEWLSDELPSVQDPVVLEPSRSTA
jgi:AraC-like DNA-binding protein